MNYFRCFDCKKVAPFMGTLTEKCPLCQGYNGNVIDSQQLTEGMDVGVFYDIDLYTGKRMKKKRK